MTTIDLECGISDIRHFLRANYPQLACAIQPINPDVPEPFPEEARLLSPNAVSKRRLEFAAGRHAARKALKLIGQSNCPISKGQYGQPMFPDGLIGSITHTESLAVAIVGTANNQRGIGVDLELVQRFKPDLSDAVLTPIELRHVNDENQLAAHFSAKEAAYKAIFTTLGKVIGFQDVELSFDDRGKAFSAKAITGFSSMFPIGKDFLNGRVLTTQGMILSVALFG